MLDLSPRQQQILLLARKNGAVGVDDLANQFEVTPQTIRKDLNELCDARHLTRTHGGDIDIFVTDVDPPESIIDLCRHRGVQIDLASQESEFEKLPETKK